MKLKAVKDSIGGYRVAGTDIIWARQNECRCCWYVWDETVAYAKLKLLLMHYSYAQAKEQAFKHVTERATAAPFL
jgi:hypothetical protein